MARGKYAEKAAKRRAELEVTTDLATYQHRVAKLTAENAALRERLAAQDRAAKQAERRLRAERDEGVAPQVEALSLVLRQTRENLDKSQRDLASLRKRDDRLIRRLIGHFESQHSMSPLEAREALLAIVPVYGMDEDVTVAEVEGSQVATIADTKTGVDIKFLGNRREARDTTAARRIQRARGFRS